MNFSGRRVLVTGASSGIGEAAARQFAAGGAEVVLVSEQDEALRKVAASINEAGGKAYAVVADFSQPEQVRYLWSRCEELAGPIDTLVNNAGVGLGASVLETQTKDLRFLFEINFFALAALCQDAFGSMSKRGFGWIINVSSAAARFGSPRVSAYSATKGAVHTFTQALRAEAAPLRVRVSEVLPISVRTAFFDSVKGSKYLPAGVVLTAEKVAETIVQCAASARPPAEALPFWPVRLVFALETIAPTFVARIVAARLQPGRKSSE